MIKTVNRCYYDILFEVLIFCKQPRKTTEILEKCNISSITFHNYYDKYLTVVKNVGKTRNVKIYKTSNVGLNFIIAFRKVKKVIDEN